MTVVILWWKWSETVVRTTETASDKLNSFPSQNHQTLRMEIWFSQRNCCMMFEMVMSVVTTWNRELNDYIHTDWQLFFSQIKNFWFHFSLLNAPLIFSSKCLIEKRNNAAWWDWITAVSQGREKVEVASGKYLHLAKTEPERREKGQAKKEKCKINANSTRNGRINFLTMLFSTRARVDVMSWKRELTLLCPSLPPALMLLNRDALDEWLAGYYSIYGAFMKNWNFFFSSSGSSPVRRMKILLQFPRMSPFMPWTLSYDEKNRKKSSCSD